MSVSHGSESSGEGQLLKGRRQGRSDFQDSPWYDNRGATPSAVSSPRRDRDVRGEWLCVCVFVCACMYVY